MIILYTLGARRIVTRVRARVFCSQDARTDPYPVRIIRIRADCGTAMDLKLMTRMTMAIRAQVIVAPISECGFLMRNNFEWY